jgi:hypothetical protein
VRTRVGRLWWRKADHMRLDRAQKQNNEGGGPVWATPRRGRGENGARHPGSCAGAAEMGVDQAVSGVMREQGSGRRACVGCT